MCLRINTKLTEKIRNQLSSEGYLIGYKVIFRSNHSLYHSTPIPTSGWYESNYDGLYEEFNTIQRGIHIFLDFYDANHEYIYQFYRVYNVKIITVKCYKDDFIAAGLDGDAVFKRVWIDKLDEV